MTIEPNTTRIFHGTASAEARCKRVRKTAHYSDLRLDAIWSVAEECREQAQIAYLNGYTFS